MSEPSRHVLYRQQKQARVADLEAQVASLTALVASSTRDLSALSPDEQVCAKLEAALASLTGADNLLTARDIRAGIQAVETWTRARRFSADTVRKAAEVRVKADYHFGRMLKESEKSQGAKGSLLPPRERGNNPLPRSAPTYADLGIDKMDASRCQQLARATPEQFEAIVTQAAEAGEKLTLTRATRLVHKTQQPTPPAEPIPLPEGVFEVLYADPPWQDDLRRGTPRDVASHYATMPLEDIKRLPVPGIVAKDAVLFLWARSPMLPEAMEVMTAWGFDYRSSIVWHKQGPKGLGYYVRVNHEFLLIGVKGDPGAPKPEDRPDSVLFLPKKDHSRKPPEFRAQVEAMYPGKTRRVELFAREEAPGWVAWGDQVVLSQMT